MPSATPFDINSSSNDDGTPATRRGTAALGSASDTDSKANRYEIIAAVTSVAGDAPRPLALHEPLFAGNESRYVASCIEAGWVSSAGAFVERFEKELAAYCGARHAVATVNGTCALHAALVTSGVRPGDEVLAPSLTFVATANAIAHAGAVPHFVEVEEASLGVDPQALAAYLESAAVIQDGQAVSKASGRVIRAFVPVHVFGHPCRIEALSEVAQAWHLQLIEDASEALGSRRHGRPVGGGHTAILSFNGNKILTTGGGGAILTADEALHRRLKHLTATARTAHAWHIAHDEVGWNYRMPNINAALGCAQLERMPRFLAAKRSLAARYIEAFAAVPGVRVLEEPEGAESNYWLVTLLAERGGAAWLEETLAALHASGFLCRPVWTPLHLLPMYRHCPRTDLALTESLAQRLISLPSSVKLGLNFTP